MNHSQTKMFMESPIVPLIQEMSCCQCYLA